MGDLQDSSLLLYLLILSSSGSVTVPPSRSDHQVPASDWIAWPESNKVAITVQCPNHVVQLLLSKIDNTEAKYVGLRGKDAYIWTRCGDVWLEHPAGISGPCRGNVGSTDTLILEWTQEGVKLMRDEEIILSQTWGPTYRSCLEKINFWRIKNHGSTVISAKSILGK